MSRVLSIIGALVAASFMVLPAHAAVITYTLENVIFDDGGTASGSFDYDTSTGDFSNVSIVTTAGSVLEGTSYGNSGTAGGFFNDFGSIRYVLETLTPINDQLGLSALISLSTIREQEFDIPRPGVATLIRERFGTGQLVTDDLTVSEVPVPAALPLFLAGLAALGLVRRRQRAHTGNAL